MSEITKLKILYLTQFSNIGGGESSLIYLLSKLNSKQFKPIVIVPKNGQLSQNLRKTGIETHMFNLPPYLWRTFFIPGLSPTATYKFYQLARKIKPDLIHLNHLTLSVYAGIAGKLLRFPVVATSHGPWDSIYFYQDLIINLFVNKIFVNNSKLAHALTRRKILNRDKTKIVPFGIDTTVFKPASRKQKAESRKLLYLPQHSLVVTIVGRLDPQKDHLTFLKAAKIVKKKVENSIFLIVGSKLGDFSHAKSNYYSQINNYLRDNPDLRKKTRLTGFINSDLMPQIYQASDILVSTSPSESFGLALAEGAASGLPIIATTSHNVIIKDGKNGYLLPPNQPGLVAEKIITLAKNPKIRQKLARNGRKFIQQNFSLEKYAGAIQNQYREILGSNKR